MKPNFQAQFEGGLLLGEKAERIMLALLARLRFIEPYFIRKTTGYGTVVFLPLRPASAGHISAFTETDGWLDLADYWATFPVPGVLEYNPAELVPGYSDTWLDVTHDRPAYRFNRGS